MSLKPDSAQKIGESILREIVLSLCTGIQCGRGTPVHQCHCISDQAFMRYSALGAPIPVSCHFGTVLGDSMEIIPVEQLHNQTYQNAKVPKTKNCTFLTNPLWER